MNASIREAVRVYCESCNKEKRRPSCFGCVFEEWHDDLGDAVADVAVEMDSRRSIWERIRDRVRAAELLAVLLWRGRT
jgi:hypothetical protein